MRSSAVPLGHKLIALILAVGVAAGLFVELRLRATQSAASAVLTFDGSDVQAIDPAILQAPKPAIALGQAILTDATVTQLLPQAGLPASASGIGQFRTHLDLNQLSPGLLAVHYRDASPARSATITNAVAETLASWSPRPLSSRQPAPTATAPPAPTARRAVHPAQKKAAAPAHPAGNAAAPSHAFSTALASLDGQLMAAQRRVGGPDERTGYSPNAGEQQRYLESQFRAALQKLNDLRSQAATSDSVPDARRSIAAIRDALLSGGAGSAEDFHTTGTSTAQLRREKARLADVIAVVDAQRRTFQREEDARAPAANTPGQDSPGQDTNPQPAPAPTHQDATNQDATNPASTNSPAANSADTSAAPPSSQPGLSVVHPFTGLDNPLRLQRLAGPAGPILWWPAVVAGCLCGLIYLAAVSARYRTREDFDEPEEYAAASAPSSHRMITPPDPVRDTQREEMVESPPPAPVVSHKRASFMFEPDSPEITVPPTILPAPAAATEPVEPAPVEARLIEPASVEAASFDAVPLEAAPFEAAPVQPAPVEAAPLEPAVAAIVTPDPAAIETAPPAEMVSETALRAEPGRDEPAEHRIMEAEAAPLHENVIEIADPWAVEVRKALAQTVYGRMMESSPTGKEESSASREADESEQQPRPGRMAG